MSNYSKTTDFEAKDSLPTGDSGKIIRGAEFETEFDAISTAIATKADTAGPTFTGTLTFETISDGTIGVTAFVDEDDMSSDSATLVPTQQSVKAYVDSQVTAQDLDFQADSGGALSIDLDSETMTFTGGTGITTAGSGNDVEFAIDSTVATLTGSQTLISKTLTSPVLNGSVTGTAVLDEDNMASNSATKLATQQSIKAYVDTTVAATNELVEDSTPQLGGTLDLNGNNITGTGNINNTGTVTTDGLTVEGSSGSTLNNVNFLNTSTAYAATANRLGLGTTNSVGANYTYIEANNDVADGRPSLNFYTGDTATKRLRITDGGDVEFYEDGGSTAKLTWDASDEDLKFADNAKATFGAGNDLQIYHTGSHSFIQDTGVGDLYLATNGDKIILRNTTLGESFFEGTSNGDAKIFYNGLEKLATTSTGIDVTGTVTADGLTVQTAQGDITIPSSTSSLNFARAGANYIRATDTAGSFHFVAGANDFATTRLRISANGDVALFEDTGSTPKFYWDASAESLGIGTTSPAAPLAVEAGSAGTTVASFKNSGFFGLTITPQVGGSGAVTDIRLGAGESLSFSPSNTEAMRIDSSGNVGIGTSSPDTLLELVGDDPVLTIRDSATSSATANATLRLAETGASDTLDAYWDIKAVGGDLQFIDNWNEGGGTGTRLVIDDSGNVGIGTDSPAKELHLASAQPDFRMQDTDGTDQYAEFTESNGSLFIGSRNGASNGQILFRGLGGGSSNEFMRITSAGNLGIGTSTPASPLHVFNATATSTSLAEGLTLSNNNGTAGHRLPAITWDYGTAGTPTFAAIDASRASGTGGNLLFHTATTGGTLTEAMRIDANGNVGVGTSSVSTSKLHVQGTTGTASAVRVESTAADSDAYYIADNDASVWTWGIDGGNGDAWTLSNAFGLGTPKLTVKTGGNVGINLNSPTKELEIQLSSTTATTLGQKGGLQFYSSSSTVGNGGEITWQSGTGNTERWCAISGHIVQNNSGGSSGDLVFATKPLTSDTTLTEAMRIDSSGRVGIGEDNPVEELHISGSVPKIQIQDSDGTNQYGQFYHSAGITSIQARNGSTDGIIAFQRYDGTTTDESARIDSSGNLLVGQSSTTTPGIGNTTLGSSILAGGLAAFSRAGGATNATLYVNKNTDDGPIARFSKNGNEVGSIGANVARFYIHGSYGSGSGLRFDNASIRPATSTGTSSDATTDLGASAARYKDLYLSGGAYLGGVAAANKLDDYEEGTWTPTLTGSTTAPSTTQQGTGKYTKVGNLVIVEAKLSNKDVTGVSGNWVVTGLPFTSDGNAQGTAWSGRVGSSTDMKMAYINSSNEIILVDGGGNALTWATAGTGTYAAVTIAFMVA